MAELINQKQYLATIFFSVSGLISTIMTARMESQYENKKDRLDY
jgi:hypothetical protein